MCIRDKLKKKKKKKKTITFTRLSKTTSKIIYYLFNILKKV